MAVADTFDCKLFPNGAGKPILWPPDLGFTDGLIVRYTLAVIIQWDRAPRLLSARCPTDVVSSQIWNRNVESGFVNEIKATSFWDGLQHLKEMASAEAFQEFVAALSATNRTAYSHAGALAFLAYDIIISYDQEIKYIWGSKLSPITTLYFIVRYYSVINLIAIVGIATSTNLSVPVCRAYFLWTLPAGPSLFVGILDGILLLRVFGLYRHSKRVFITLFILIIGDVASSLYAMIRLSKDLAPSVMPMPAPWRGCISKFPEMKFVLTAYIPNYALSLIFLGMTLWKLVENHQNMYGKLTLKNIWNTGNISPLLLGFVRDGSVFFALASTATFIGLLPTFAVRGPEGAGFFLWTLAIYSYSGAHLILNLRAASTKGNTDLSWDETLSAQFHPEGGGITFA